MANGQPSPNALPTLQDNWSAAGLRSAKVDLLVPAGKVVPVEVPGKFFRVLESDAPLQIRYDSGPFIPHDIGTGQILPAPLDQNGVPRQTYFKRLEIRNTSLVVDSNVTLFIGTDDYVDDRLNLTRLAEGKYLPVMEGKTRVAGWAGNSLAGAASITSSATVPIDGGDVAYVDIKKQSVVFTNLDLLNDIDIRDDAGTKCGVVFPAKQIILPVSEAITFHNGTGGALACHLLEIWTTRKA